MIVAGSDHNFIGNKFVVVFSLTIVRFITNKLKFDLIWLCGSLNSLNVNPLRYH